MAAHEDEAQHVVVDEVAGVGTDAATLAGTLGVDDEQRFLAQGDRLGPQPVDDPTPGGGEQPGGRALRDPVPAPRACGGLHGIPQGVLDEVEAAELREEQGRPGAPTPRAPWPRGPRQRSRGGSYPSISTVGRISTV